MRGWGTDEPWFGEDPRVIDEIARVDLGRAYGISMSWRKPLRIDEIARMAPTREVRERKGRP
jgi:hypothetical protein